MNDAFAGIYSVARKEVLTIVRDVRIMVLVLVLPPLLTVIFGHAFEVTALENVAMVLQDRDGSATSQKFVTALTPKKTFAWKIAANDSEPNLVREQVKGALVIPKGWGDGLKSKPLPLQLITDGSDTTTSPQIEGAIRAALGDFQLADRQALIDELPTEVFEMGEKLPVETRKRLTSAMDPWPVQLDIIFNPKLRFIEFVTPGIIGLILQLMTVTLMACTIARERESGTIYQLMVTSLRRSEIVIGKVLPYLVLSLFLIGLSVAVAGLYFHVEFKQPLVLALICFLFLCCSLGLGLLISAFCQTQAQAIQLAVFYLLPVFPLSGAFAPLEQLPGGIRLLAQTFPLTHFCAAFREINLHNAPLSFIAGHLIFLALGAVVTCAGAGWLLRRMHE